MAEERMFNPLDLLISADEVRIIEVEGLGLVRYKPLTTREAITLSQEKLDPATLAAKEAWTMLHKADPEFMPFDDFLDRTDGRAVSRLVLALSRERDFRVSNSASHPTLTPRP